MTQPLHDLDEVKTAVLDDEESITLPILPTPFIPNNYLEEIDPYIVAYSPVRPLAEPSSLARIRRQTNRSLPAILGGDPLADPPLPFVRPKLPQLDEMIDSYREVFHNGMITTGRFARELGEKAAQKLGVKHAVAVSSCTTGLVLAVQALHLPEGSEVILPSFTFMASALGPVWNRLRLRFVDVDRETMNIDPQAVEVAVTSNTSAIMAVHEFGNPSPIEELHEIADRRGLALIFDSAHGLGALHHNQPLGKYGDVEIFSLTPTKLVVAAEGGIVTTNNDQIADHIQTGRNYGNPGNYDCLFPGLNARMSELHAILALHSFSKLETAVQHRTRAVEQYRDRLARVPGISFQSMAEHDRSAYKDFTIVVDETEFGVSQKQLAAALLAEGIQTRIYYSPVLHKMEAFRAYAEPDADRRLPNTVYLESHVLSLPLYSDMSETDVDTVCAAIERIHAYSQRIGKL